MRLISDLVNGNYYMINYLRIKWPNKPRIIKNNVSGYSLADCNITGRTRHSNSNVDGPFTDGNIYRVDCRVDV